jgi:hypothetical protein
MSKSPWFFVDVEADGQSPVKGTMTEFGVVHYDTKETFHGILFEGHPDPENPAKPVVGDRVATAEEVVEKLDAWISQFIGDGRAVMISDNPAYDFMWIAGMYDEANVDNRFGHSARRISDFYAGVQLRWSDTQSWKELRETVHDHNPVNDAMGNVEAFRKIQEIVKEKRSV